jgi:adenylosuccinate lyase
VRYESPFSNRYGSAAMRSLWSERAKRRLWRRVWVAVAEAQAEAGLVSEDQLADIKAHALHVDLPRALEIESEIGHDLMAELKAFAEQCPRGGAVLHWGLTSADVEDNADVLRQKAGLAILIGNLRNVLLLLADQIEAHAELPVMGYTHLQPAEPTSLGYRLSVYAQDLMLHLEILAAQRRSLKGKGIKGAVGTSATFREMLTETGMSVAQLEQAAMSLLGLQAFPISTQTYPRVQDYRLLASLGGLAASLHKFALDIRLMQSPGVRTASEPFGDRQVGSSAMPFKRNPVGAEKICSLAREVQAAANVAWSNAANTMLERTLDDSANRRSIIPEAFLACDEMLRTAHKILDGLVVDRVGIEEWLQKFGPFSATERLLTALVRAGADRQAMHERLRQHSQRAWEALQEGHENPLEDLLAGDPALLTYLQPARIRALLQVQSYLGNAPQEATGMAARIRKRLQPSSGPPAAGT